MDALELKLRPAKKEDVRKVFELANDDLVRANSFSTAKIPFPDHEEWFERKLGDKSFLMIIAEVGGKFAGQVKVENEDENVIGISICPDFRGKGFGAPLLVEGLKFTKKHWPEIKFVTAYIKKANIPSQRIFEKAGFISQDELEMGGEPSSRYVYNFNR